MNEKLDGGERENEEENGTLDAERHHHVELDGISKLLAIVQEGIDLVARVAENGVDDHGVDGVETGEDPGRKEMEPSKLLY